MALLLSAGCASHSVDLSAVRASLVADDIPKAVEQFDARKEKKTDLLYLLEKGYLYHLDGRWQESNTAFEAAEQRADELYTKSISRQAAALLTSDLALPYRGMPYELQLVQYYRALNYLELGQPAEALVEARKANFKLAQYAEKNADDKALRQDAFLQYFTGLLYESQGEANDAVVSFRDAAGLYRKYESEYGLGLPSWLPEDFLAAAKHVGLHNEIDSLVHAEPNLEKRMRAANEDNLVIFFELGFVSYRKDVEIHLPIVTEEDEDNKDKDEHKSRHARRYVDRYGNHVYDYRADKVKLDHVLSFAFPELLEYPYEGRGAEVILPDGRRIVSEPALDLDAVARSEFNDRLPGTLLKTIARALVKEQTRKAAKKKDEGLGWLVNIVNSATEQADTRGLIFLPGKITMLKTHLPPGHQTVKARITDREGQMLEEWEIGVFIPEHGTKFVSLRSFN